MDRNARGRLALAGAGLILMTTGAGCGGAFHRRGIPPEPRVAREAGPVGFGSAPKPYGDGLGSPAPATIPTSPLAPDPVPTPIPAPAPDSPGLAPGITNPGNAVEEVGQMGAPGMPPSPL